MIIDRKLGVEMLVLVGVCIGAWMMIVQPKRAEYRELEAKITAAETNPVQERRAAIEHMAGQVAQVRERVREIHGQSRFGRDVSQMYGLIMGLGNTHGVTIRRLDPSTQPRRDGVLVDVGAFNMSIEGTYERVGNFLQGIEDIDGFVRPGSLSLTPIGDDRNALVSATFVCEALSFNLPDALAGMVEKVDAHE
jgi:Tfp pilus assembly protein PilO